MTTQKYEIRIAEITTLKSGGHSGLSDGACIMEAAAYVAGEPWSDHPQCVSPVIGVFLRNWNDSLRSDDERTRLLKPLLPKILSTTADPATEERRSYLSLDWMIRTYLPAWLRLTKLDEHADAIAALAPIVDMATATAAAPLVLAANDAASKAWDAAAAAAAAAAGDAAGAGFASRDAAGAAARAAARAAAAAGDALRSTTEQLQLSAVDLVERMAAPATPAQS